MDMETHENILHGREVGKKTGILIGTSNTELNDLVGQQADERVVVEKNLSRLRSIEASDAVEKGRLSSPVGPNDAVNTVFFELRAVSLCGREALRLEKHHGYQSSAVAQQPVLSKLPQQFRQTHEGNGSD